MEVSRSFTLNDRQRIAQSRRPRRTDFTRISLHFSIARYADHCHIVFSSRSKASTNAGMANNPPTSDRAPRAETCVCGARPLWMLGEAGNSGRHRVQAGNLVLHDADLGRV